MGVGDSLLNIKYSIFEAFLFILFLVAIYKVLDKEIAISSKLKKMWRWGRLRRYLRRKPG